MSEVPRVDIALATYNGARFLPEQLDSLAAQTWPNLRVCVSDDGSTDDTLEVIEGRRGALDIRIAPTDPQRNITRNFENALRCTDAPYVALCDQDDVWDPRKIALLQAKVAAFETRYGKDVPALAFCDLAIVDEALGVINASYFQSSIKSGEASDFRDFVLNNHVPGCAMLMNRALLDIALPFPPLDIHDHWLIQLAAIFGNVGYVNVSLVRYRQHGSNSIGLARVGEGKLAKALRLATTFPAELLARRRAWVGQAAAVRNNMTQLRVRFGARLPREARAIVDAILDDPRAGRIRRALGGARHGDRGIDVRGVTGALQKLGQGAKMALTVEKVVQGNLCLGCGACANLPDVTMALSERGFNRPTRPEALRSKPQPGLAAICSGHAVEQDAAGRPYDDTWGPMLELWTGNSTDPEVRYRGSSGGVISQIAIHLLESKTVDFVVHTRADPDEPLGNVTSPSYSRADVLSGAGSRYAPSSPLAELNAYLETGKQFAFVGKPCDIAALRRMAKVDPRIDAQVPYMLSFFCAGVPSRFGALALLKKLDVEAVQVSKFEFRGRGWPGLTRATRVDGSEATMDYHSSWGMVLSRTLQFRCKVCPDGTGEFADIVCADAWYGKDGYPDFEERDGRSLVMVRTERGRKLLRSIEGQKLIELEPLDAGEIEKMQPYQRDRKRVILARLGALVIGGWRRPRYTGLRLAALTARSNPVWLAKNALGTLRRLPSTPPGS